jgi:hypothetical protein
MTPVETGILLEEIVAVERVREENEWNRAGLICATVATVMTGKKHKPEDFFKSSQPETTSRESFRNYLLTNALLINERNKSRRRTVQ